MTNAWTYPMKARVALLAAAVGLFLFTAPAPAGEAQPARRPWLRWSARC
jgi:hypothetical protein